MSNPSFSNIDLWLFELAEGNLTPQQVAQLELFLLQHPELDVDRDMWHMAKVDATPVEYPNAEKHRKGRPVGLYFAVGSIAILGILGTGLYQYFGSEMGTSDNSRNYQSTTIEKNERESYEAEILSLKLKLAELEKKNKETSVSQAEAKHNSNQNNTHQNNVVPSNTFVLENNFNSQGSGVEPYKNALNNLKELSPNQGGQKNQNTLAMNKLEPISYDSHINSNERKAELSSRESMLDPVVDETIEIIEQFNKEVEKEEEELATSVGMNKYSTFKHRMSKFGRSMQRMMDNPVALKNSRDPHYHVPGMSEMDINFGTVGTIVAPRVQTMSRLQWYGQSNELLSNQLAFDVYNYGMRGGIGVQMNHSYYNQGGIQSSNVALTYSPKLSISRTISVEPALRFKMGNKNLNDNSMGEATQVEMDRGNVYDYYTGGSNPIGQDLWYKDIGLGVNVNTKWFFAGVQVDNILQHKDNIYSNDLSSPRTAGTHFVATVGTDWVSHESKKQRMSLSPYMVYQNKEDISEAWLGVNYGYEFLKRKGAWFTLGGAISSNLDPAASIGMKFDHFSVHYNADYSNSIMNNQRNLSHQLSLRFTGKPSRVGKRLLNL